MDTEGTAFDSTPWMIPLTDARLRCAALGLDARLQPPRVFKGDNLRQYTDQVRGILFFSMADVYDGPCKKKKKKKEKEKYQTCSCQFYQSQLFDSWVSLWREKVVVYCGLQHFGLDRYLKAFGAIAN